MFAFVKMSRHAQRPARYKGIHQNCPCRFPRETVEKQLGYAVRNGREEVVSITWVICLN